MTRAKVEELMAEISSLLERAAEREDPAADKAREHLNSAWMTLSAPGLSRVRVLRVASEHIAKARSLLEINP